MNHWTNSNKWGMVESMQRKTPKHCARMKLFNLNVDKVTMIHKQQWIKCACWCDENLNQISIFDNWIDWNGCDSWKYLVIIF
jgi:hypothetical protein